MNNWKPRKFTSVEDMREKVLSYFNSITRWKDKTEQVPIKYNKKGVAVEWEERAVFDNNGNVMRELEWFDIPTIGGLALYLNLDKVTLYNYGKIGKYGNEYKVVMEEALAIIEDRWAKQLYQLGNTRGVIFNLSCNFGWTDDPAEQRLRKKEKAKEIGESTSLSDKIAYLKASAGGQAFGIVKADPAEAEEESINPTDEGE